MLSVLMRGAQALAVAALVAALAAWLPGAGAVQVTIEDVVVDPPVVVPESGVAAVTASVRVQCGPSETSLGAPLVLILLAGGPDYLKVTGPAAVEVPQGACRGGPASQAATVPATLSVVATKDAPGLAPIPLNLTASVAPGSTWQAGEGTASAAIVADYVALLQVKVDAKVAQVEPGDRASFPHTIHNFGNAQTTVRLALDSGDSRRVTFPEAVTIDAGAEATVPVDVGTDRAFWWTNEKTSFQVRFTPVATLDEQKQGEPVTTSVLVRERGGLYWTALWVALVVGPLGWVGWRQWQKRQQAAGAPPKEPAGAPPSPKPRKTRLVKAA